MEIKEYKRFLRAMSPEELREYLYRLDYGTLTKDERRELEYYLGELKVKEVLTYLAVYGFLALVGSALIKKLRLTKPTDDELKEPGDVGRKFDLIFTITSGACPECVAESGKIYGKETDRIPGPGMHPHCRCKFVKVYREEIPKVKAMNLKYAPGGAVRAFGADDGMVLEVLAAPFGGPGRKDRLGQYLSARTDFMIDVGGRRPTLYLHGYSPKRRVMEKPPVLGIAEVIRIDDQGLWMRTELDNSELSRRTWEAAKRGEAKASTGSIAHLERHSEVTGEVTCWPIAELSVFDGGDERVPVSDDAVVIPLRALFDDLELDFDERFEAGEAMDLTGRRSEMMIMDENPNLTERDWDEMPKGTEIQDAVASALKAERDAEVAEKEKVAALRAEWEKENEEEPKHRAIFNIGGKTTADLTITDEEAKRGVTKASKEENHAFVWSLMHPTQAPPAMRVLEESEALEGGPMVPQDMLNRIVELKGARSLVDKIGISRLKTNRLIFNFPTETAGMGALAAIAEEGAYLVDEPAFATVAATLVKYGHMITVTEEMFDDQDLFEPYFIKAVARAWALAENTELFTKLKATDTVGASDATFTDVLIMQWFFAMTAEWAEGAHMLCLRGTLGTMRALLIATPRAYGAFPDFGGGAPPTFMGVPLHTDANWEAVGAGATTLTLSLVHPDAVGWVENKGLQIKVDPYGDSANGRIRYFPRARFDCEILQILGHVSYLDA